MLRGRVTLVAGGGAPRGAAGRGRGRGGRVEAAGRPAGPGRWPAPRLVDARQPSDTCLPGSSLVVVGRRRRRRHEGSIDYGSVAPVAGTRGARFSLRRAA